MTRTFSLHVVVCKNTDDEHTMMIQPQKDDDSCVIVHSESCRISQSQGDAQYALIFVPATIVDSSLEQLSQLDDTQKRRASNHLLSMIHPFLAQNFPLKAIIRAEFPLVLLDLSHTPAETILDVLEQCPILHSGPEAILQALLIDQLLIVNSSSATDEPPMHSTTTTQQQFNIPVCPICLHRIHPPRLGMRLPPNEQLCSRFYCPTRNCPKQRLLEPWSSSNCAACRVIHICRRQQQQQQDIACMTCGMKETLWVCLTCAFIGCGRYSNKHAAQHFRETGHPFCLELTTLRIWDYCGEGFAHRVDLLECPSTSSAVNNNGGGEVVVVVSDNHDGNKSTKMATMIGEEYEALLQSALEEQAQHYEGETSRLRAELTASVVSRDNLSEMEQVEIDRIAASNDALRANIESTKRGILELQSQEVPLRAASNRLLREQQVAKDLLSKIKEETKREQQTGKLQVEELEQQIADLTANQRMREQFTQDQELQNAQIFGTSELKKKAAKPRRFFRK